MPYTRLRPRFVLSCSVALLAVGTLGCSAGPGSVTGDTDTLEVSTSQFYITVANRSGSSLVDVKVDVEPVGGATTYTSSYPRMDPGQKRDFAYPLFRGNDGTPLDLRVAKPKLVRVTAKDTTGRTYELQSPWSP